MHIMEKLSYAQLIPGQWLRTTNNFTKRASKQRDQSTAYINLSDTLDSNYERILQFDQVEQESDEERKGSRIP